ncbi:hypothetical protein [Pantanalinema sp. GBBB05]|uniref:hypothetical protein n=1 Tax=Pantanalinema sp. GBBB05 TaxID=2604139 RepID=UPI001D61B078|nr:hypothetical protein [Pantanalinema sp. GBBB05]
MCVKPSLTWTVGLAIATVSLLATSARADRPYTDITGTNYWNNVAPLYDGVPIDPDIIARTTQLNQDAETAFAACNDAIAQFEQQNPAVTPRRFARQPLPAPPTPEACVRLEELRTQAETLRATLADLERSRPNPALRSW